MDARHLRRQLGAEPLALERRLNELGLIAAPDERQHLENEADKPAHAEDPRQ